MQRIQPVAAVLSRLCVGVTDIRYTLEEARTAGVSALECVQKVLERWDNAANYDEKAPAPPCRIRLVPRIRCAPASCPSCFLEVT